MFTWLAHNGPRYLAKRYSRNFYADVFQWDGLSRFWTKQEGLHYLIQSIESLLGKKKKLNKDWLCGSGEICQSDCFRLIHSPGSFFLNIQQFVFRLVYLSSGLDSITSVTTGANFCAHTHPLILFPWRALEDVMSCSIFPWGKICLGY